MLGRLKTFNKLSSPIHIEKPWGYELLWAQTDEYVGKLLFVKAGQSLSLQFHEKKEETIFLESGLCEIQSGSDQEKLETTVLKPGESFHVPPGLIHRFIAKEDCRIFEVSTNFLEDVVRLKDLYGRK